MKELESYSKVTSEVKATKPIQKQKELLGSLHPHKGHKCFEINTITQEVEEVTYKDIVYEFNRGVRKEINVKENHVYITALNRENAIKKYNKLKGR